MMKSNRIAVLVSFLLIVAVVRLGAATQPKFRSSGSTYSGLGRYLVTLAAEADSEDLAATKGELAALYGARLDPDAPDGIRQFAVTATAARARLLSSDPRVSEVIETPATLPAPSAPVPRHFKPQITGYGDNGQSGTYTYDSSGNITAIGTDTYLYDVQGRLKTSVTRGVEEDYTYDAFGNRKTATGATNCLGQTVCAQPVTVSNTTNRLLTINGATVHYEAPGNIIGIDAITGSLATSYLYDGTEMMTESTVGSDDRLYVYTADDERIAVKQGASWTWTVRDLNQKVLREFTSAETGGANFAMTSRVWLKDYVWRDGLLLATTTPSGTLNYHLDHLGTPRLITDANRVKVAEHAYYPFGAEINLAPHETPEEAMKFTGHERDIVAGDGHTLDYMHARFYNAIEGRFLSVDRHQGNPGEPQSWNRYAYADNKPIGKSDPNGWQAAVPAPGVGPSAFLSLALYHLQQMNSNPAYRDAAVHAVRTMQVLSLGVILTVSRPFLVTPLGTVLPGGKDVNLVPTGTGTDKWLQIHDSHPHDGVQPHTHEPETHVGPDGRESTIRTDHPTTADDIDKADQKVKDGELRPRTGRKDKGDRPTPAPDPKPDSPTDLQSPQLIP